MGPIYEVIKMLGFFALVVLIVYFLERSRHEERMALIRKGVNPQKYRVQYNGQYSLLLGILFLTVGLGFTVTLIISGQWKADLLGPFAISLSAVLGGIGFIVYWKVTAAQREQARKMLEQQIATTGMDFAPDQQIDTDFEQ